MHKKKSNWLLIVLIILAIAGIGIVLWLQHEKKETEISEDVEDEGTNQGYIEYNGEKYAYNANLKTMLFLGIDKDEVATVRDVTGHSGQSDCIILMIMDQEKKTIQLLEISRDSMTDVDIYGMNGDYLDTQLAQIATQYAYGTGDKDSCRLSVDAVTKLLYDIRINDYLALNMAGIAPIVDAVGGVKITIPQDYTEIDPAFTEGTEITLNGEQAERYIRYRDTSQHGSNNGRMERQTQFIQALFAMVGESEDAGLSMLRSFWSAGEDYMTTNVSLKTLEKLTSYTMEQEIIKVPGEVRIGEVHDEFYVDEDALKEIIINTFYNKI